MAYIKGQPGHFFFEVRDMETGELFPGCTFSKKIVYVDGNTDLNTSTSPSFDAWSTLDASLRECRISGSESGLWCVSIPTLPNNCETLTFHFIPTAGLNVHVPLVTISLENAPAESVDISELATSAELESVRHELSSDISTSTQEIGRIPYNVWNYALPSNISSSYVGGYLKNMYASVNSIQQDMPNAAEISSSVWSQTQRTLTSPVISDSVRLATKDNVADAREYIVLQCATASGFATPADVNSAKDAIITQCATATGFATPADVQLTTTTEKVEVISQTVDLSGMATLANQQAILTDLATIRTTTNDISKDVSSVYSYVTEISEIPEAVWNYGTDFNARTVKANGVSLDGTDLSVQVDASSIAAAVWSSPERELTQDVAAPADVNYAKTEILSKCRTATGFARAETVDPALNLISALIKRWKVSGSTLTAYGNSGEVLGRFTLTKNANGQIIEVS